MNLTRLATELSPQMEKASEIIGIITAILLIIALLTAFIIAIIVDSNTTRLRENYIKSLNEHDKAVIMQLKATRYHFKKKNKNENQSMFNK